jgi:hypothetical protein
VNKTWPEFALKAVLSSKWWRINAPLGIWFTAGCNFLPAVTASRCVYFSMIWIMPNGVSPVND